MRKLQNPPKDGPERLPAPKVWKVAALLAAAIALKPGAANAQLHCQPWDGACRNEQEQIRLGRENLERDERGVAIAAAREELREQIPQALDEVKYALDELEASISSIRIALQPGMDGTETEKKFVEARIELLDLATSLIPRIEESLEFDPIFSLIMSCRFNSCDGQVDPDAIALLLVSTPSSPRVGLSAPMPLLLPASDMDASRFLGSKFKSLDSISQFATALVDGAANPFRLLYDLSSLMTPEEYARFTEITVSLLSLEEAYAEEMRVLTSNYMLRGPLSLLSTSDMQKVQDYSVRLSRSAFLASTPADQASEIAEMLLELDINPEIGAPLASAAAVLLRISTDRGASQDAISSMYSPTDAQTMMDAAASFLTAEEVTAFKIFLGLEQPPVSPPAPLASPAPIVQDDSSNPFLLATNYIFRGPLAQLDEDSREKIIHYLAGNTPRITNGFAGYFSQMPPDKQYGAVLITLMESGVNFGNMDLGFSAAAAVLSHLGTMRGASPEVMQEINSPTDAATMLNAAESFLTMEEAATFRGFFGIPVTTSSSQ